MVAEILFPQRPSQMGVLILHSWWGRSRSFLRFGEALARDGFIVAVSDLYEGKLAETEAEARALRKSARRMPMYRCLEADLALLRAQIASEQSRIGVVGFSMGGHWAVWISQRPEYAISATVLYYTARGGDYGRSQSDFLAHYAQDDPWVSKSARRNMEKAIHAARCAYRSFDYSGAGHWFAESDREDAYCPKPAAIALSRTSKHLSRVLG